MRLEALFRARSIAVDRRVRKADRRPSSALPRSIRSGFTGTIFRVNPGYPAVLGPCLLRRGAWPSCPRRLMSLCSASARGRSWEPLPRRQSAGCETAWYFMTASIAEQGDDGRRLQSQIEGICREADIALCGPNCMGVLNPQSVPARPICRSCTIRPDSRRADVGIISQSGAVCISLLTDTRRLGFSHVVSSGKKAVLAAADYLENLRRRHSDRGDRGAFIETIRQPDRFIGALNRAPALLAKPVSRA